MAADETSSVAEFYAFDARNLLQLVVTDAEPAFVQEFAANKRSFFHRNALDSEVGSSAVEQDVLDVDVLIFELVRLLDFTKMLLPRAKTLEFDDLARSVDGETIDDCFFHDFASWQPGRAKVLDLVEKFSPNVLFCFVEFQVDFFWRHFFRPSGIESLHSVRQMSVDAVLRLAFKLWNSVVDPIDFLDEALINLQEN